MISKTVLTAGSTYHTFFFENFVLVLKVSYLIKLKLLKFGMAYLNKNKSEQLLYTVFKQTYIQTI